jgi:poly-beta-1,6-N-acetyl-D-glucosamine N-deacetylase
MAKEGATFANHGNKHDHMLTRLANENQQQWLDRVIADVEQAEASLSEQLGYSLKYFAYPYGEYNLPLKQALLARGYTGFAQISGAVASYSDFGAVPRYPAAGFYSKIDSLKVKLNSLAMPVLSTSPQEPELSLTTPAFTFTLNLQQDDLRLSQVSCFVSDQVVPLKQQGQSLSLNFEPKQVAGRQRINCTAPSIREKGRYYWFSQPWFTPQADGQWRD